MNLKCMINGKVSGVFLPSDIDNNRLIQGNTIAEEYSETLDSGSIILSDSPKINNLDPYDDVYIWDCDFLSNFDGITKTTNANGCIVADYSIFEDENHNKKFYKHFLVDRFTKERMLLNQNRYTYKIELFSETKGLETVVLPNIIITQPLNETKRLSTFTYMMQFLELYSPKIKVKVGNTWEYRQKYGLSPEMYDLFKNHYCQQFSLNSPTLRELFTKLMVSKDCIPIVKDNIIYPLMLSKTVGEFIMPNDRKSFIVVNKSSDGYVTQFRTNYNNALTAGATCHRIEHLGFRNSDEAILTINNMRLETGFPIYKLNRFYMCYYKKFIPLALDSTTGSMVERSPHYFLCRQDITDFLVLANERQALYKDARIASNEDLSLEEMKQCYYYTLSYSIGSNLITGFGEMFGYLAHQGFSIWNEQECIIRNLIDVLDRRYPYGIDGKYELLNRYKEDFNDSAAIEANVGYQFDFQGFNINNEPGDTDTIPSVFMDYNSYLDISGDSISMKEITFEIDYEGFYNGAIVTNKEKYKKQVMKTDNQSDSMPILDIDGIAKERKIEKMGNKMYTLTARYTNWNDVQSIGTTFINRGSDENQDYDEEIIIYHRDIALYDNCINVTYFAQESFVLKNFYTSVFAKQRLYNVLDYGNSVTRAENIKDILLFSKNRKYQIAPNIVGKYFNIKNYLSCLCQDNNMCLEYPIDIMAIEFYDKIDNQTISPIKYFADFNAFTSGNSMCINTTMFDNLTMGEKMDINHLSGKFWLDGAAWLGEDKNKNYAGTSQLLCSIHNDRETGRCEYMNFNFRSSEEKTPLFSSRETLKVWKRKEFELPLYNSSLEGKDLCSIEKKIYKDVNEKIDITFQTQLIVDKNDKKNIFLGSNLLKYNNLLRQKENKNKLARYDLLKTICLVPFQLQKIILNQAHPSQNKGSLLGFILRIPREREAELVGSSFKMDLLLAIEENKQDAWNLYVNTGCVEKWRVNFKGDSSWNNVFFLRENVHSTKISAIRIDYYSMETKLYNETATQMRDGGYIYLKEMDREFIEEDIGINKEDFIYFSNIYMNSNIPQPTDSGHIKYNPYLLDYFEDNDLVGGQIIDTIPNDTFDRYRNNNLFFGYVSPSLTLNPTINQNLVSGSEDFETLGYPHDGYISNYFYPGTNDTCLAGGEEKDLLNYSFQIYNNSYSNYGIEKFSVFKDLDTNGNVYFSWPIPGTELLENNDIVCVGAPKIEMSLVDEKVKDFNQVETPGYSILKSNGGTHISYSSIFNIEVGHSNDYSNIDSYGTLKVNLEAIPNHYDSELEKWVFDYESIQEWIYNTYKGEYYFVCGINITEEDVENYNDYKKHQSDQEYPKEGSKYITVYLSLVGNLDLEVYNDKGILVGYVGNKAKQEDDVVDLV